MQIGTKISLITMLVAVVSACGGGGSSSTNVAPRLGVIADATLSANQPSDPIPVTVQDRGAQNATVTATSSDPSVVADSGLVVSGGSQGNFSLVVTPVADTLGMSTITVTATDAGGLSTQTTFQVTLAPQQVTFSEYFRSTFAADPSDAPADVNTREFNDPGGDDYFDLLN